MPVTSERAPSPARLEDGGTKHPAFGKVWLRKSEGGDTLLRAAGMEVEDGAQITRLPAEPRSCPWGWWHRGSPGTEPALVVPAGSSILPEHAEMQKL